MATATELQEASEVVKFLRDHGFITTRQGKEMVAYGGLLNAAYDLCGLVSIETELVQAAHADNNETTIVKAKACFARDEKVYRITTGHGDANPGNVGRMIAVHCPRMAETRAKARALRDGINVGWLVATEELGGEDDEAPARPPQEEQADDKLRKKLRHALDFLGRHDITLPDNLSKASAQQKLDKLRSALEAEQQKRAAAQAAPSTDVETQDEPEADQAPLPPSEDQLAHLSHLMADLGIKGNVPKGATAEQVAAQIRKLGARLVAADTAPPADPL
jgi:hypothetical protein